jgi:hypothetical protein
MHSEWWFNHICLFRVAINECQAHVGNPSPELSIPATSNQHQISLSTQLTLETNREPHHKATMSLCRVSAALRLAYRSPAAIPAGLGRRPFHATVRAPVSVGDRLPDVELMETSPGTKVNLARELARGNGLIVGVPAAFCQWIFSSPFAMMRF